MSPLFSDKFNELAATASSGVDCLHPNRLISLECKALKDIKQRDRRVVNIHTHAFEPFCDAKGTPSVGEDILQINAHSQPGVGFHVYRMAPGTTTTPHEHTDDEEFLVLEGELVDHDGYTYRTGDLVWLKKGTQHTSHSKEGALLAVYIAKPETNLD
jgi:quercetin dioxygenase-like cupin family protein